MTIIKTITLYTYDELPTEQAKEAARDWWLEIATSDVYDHACDLVKGDASLVGLNIKMLSAQGGNDGYFTNGAVECMESILANHGPECATYKIAAAYDAAIDALPDIDQDDMEQQRRLCEAADVAENEFLVNLLAAYLEMRNAEDAFQTSEAQVIEALRANEYTFTEAGKREDA